MKISIDKELKEYYKKKTLEYENVDEIGDSILSIFEELKNIQKKAVMQGVMKDEQVQSIYRQKLADLESNEIKSRNKIKELKKTERLFLTNIIRILDELERLKEYGDTIVFLRKIVRGSADKSFGIQVAKLAGLPQQVLDRAKEVLSGLEDADVNTRDDIVLPVAENRQGNSDPLSAVIASLRKVSPETLTPIESMILLDELCRIVNGEAKCDED